MKLVILKESLQNGLHVVERIAGRNLSLPILENVLISTEKNFLHLTTTDLETAISWWGLAKIEKEGKTTLPVRFFSSLVNLLPENSIILETVNSTLSIESENVKNQLKCLDPNDFPVIPKLENNPSLKINNSIFIEGLSQVVETAASTQVRPEISGVYFNFQRDFLKMAATDSFQLAEKTIFFEEKPSQEYSFILPQKAARELINTFSEKTGKLSLYLSPNQVMFELPLLETPHPQLQIVSKFIEGEYPDYQAIIPKKHESQIITSKKDFLTRLKAAGLLSGKINEVKLTVDPVKNRMEIFSQSTDFGGHQSFLSGKGTGKKVEVSFNWRFLVEGLSNIKTPEVIFELSGEEGPAVLKPVDDSSYLYIAMPIKAS